VLFAIEVITALAKQFTTEVVNAMLETLNGCNLQQQSHEYAWPQSYSTASC